jgi:hypothetical protein
MTRRPWPAPGKPPMAPGPCPRASSSSARPCSTPRRGGGSRSSMSLYISSSDEYSRSPICTTPRRGPDWVRVRGGRAGRHRPLQCMQHWLARQCLALCAKRCAHLAETSVCQPSSQARSSSYSHESMPRARCRPTSAESSSGLLRAARDQARRLLGCQRRRAPPRRQSCRRGRGRSGRCTGRARAWGAARGATPESPAAPPPAPSAPAHRAH